MDVQLVIMGVQKAKIITDILIDYLSYLHFLRPHLYHLAAQLTLAKHYSS